MKSGSPVFFLVMRKSSPGLFSAVMISQIRRFFEPGQQKTGP